MNTAPQKSLFTKNGQLVFLNNDQKKIKKIISIEIVEDENKRARGLMWRHSMPDDFGMLFIFENEKPLFFWMENTYIPLDIIYISKLMEIVAIQKNTKPLNKNLIPSGRPAQYVLEVNAGFCDSYRITLGDKIEFEKINAR